MSRFFAADSDDDVEDENPEQPSDEEERPETRVTRLGFESSSEEDEKRVVRSEKEKKFDAMLVTIKALRNHIKISDCVALARDFEMLNKQLAAAKNVVAKEGIPPFYFRAVIDLETFLGTQKKSEVNSVQFKAMTALKQKLRKNRAAMEKEFENFEKAPQAASEPHLDDESDDDAAPKASSKRVRDPESDDESDDDDILLTDEITRDFWVKKERTVKVTTRKPRAKPVEKAEKPEKEDEEDDDGAPEPAPEKKRETFRDVEYTPEQLVKRLQELLGMFGRRGTNKQELVDELSHLASKAKDPAAALKVNTTLAAALFDSASGGEFMPIPTWKRCYDCLLTIIDLLKTNPNVRLTEEELVEETMLDDDGEDVENLPPVVPAALETKASSDQPEDDTKKEASILEKKGDVQYVTGTFYAFVNRLHNEYRKSLQNLDPHSTEYIDRLRDEHLLVKLIESAQQYYSNVGKLPLQCGVSLLRLEYESYRYHSELDVVCPPEYKAPSYSNFFGPLDSQLINQLSSFIYQHGDSRTRTRATIAHIYHLSLHNRFKEARDLMLMSHLQDTIATADIRTRIVFNRAMAQLGLCAFRCGEFRSALDCLGELTQSGRVRELLAQGVSVQRWTERDLDKERLEKMRQFPFHMHISIDFIEGAHLVSAMLFEVPNMALWGQGNRRKVISKAFRRLWEPHSKQAFNGPPENTRDRVMAATRSLTKGDWAKCQEQCEKLKLWELIPHAVALKQTLATRIREEALRTYLLTFGHQYEVIMGSFLQEMFQLSPRQINKIIRTMIINEQLQGAWDQPRDCLVIQSEDPSRLQKIALKYADKASIFVEMNEKLMDQRVGGFYGKSDNKQWRDGGRDARGGNRGGNNARFARRLGGPSRRRDDGRDDEKDSADEDD